MFSRVRDRIVELILEKAWFRSNRIWTASVVYRTPLAAVPFYMDRWALARSQYWSREQIGALTERRLERLLAEASRIPFWKRVFRDHLPQRGAATERLSALPVFSRADFKELQTEEYVSPKYLRGSVRDTTSGSTGRPFTYYMDRGTLLALRGVRDREFTAASRGISYPSMLFRADPQVQKRFHNSRFVYLRGHNDVPERFAALRDEMSAHAPDGAVLYTFASTAVALAAHMERSGETLPLRAVISVGESISAENRDFIERVTAAPFALTYATLESSSIAFECEYGRSHINEEEVYVEILDGAGTCVPEKEEGRVVLTHLGYRVMPLIRYDNGDIGSISASPCPCGRSLRTISIKGRVPVVIEQRDGYAVTLTELGTQLNHYPDAVQAYQIVHHAPDHISIHVVPGKTYAAQQENIEGRVLRKLHPETKVAFVLEHSIEPAPTGKARYYVKRF